eukprot:4773177-Amphidinium_carterae.1
MSEALSGWMPASQRKGCSQAPGCFTAKPRSVHTHMSPPTTHLKSQLTAHKRSQPCLQALTFD